MQEIRSLTDSERDQAYKRIMKIAFETAQTLSKHPEWVSTKESNSSIQVFEMPNSVKIEAIIDVSSYILYCLCKDLSYVTRSQWDSADLLALDQLESYGDIHIFQAQIRMPPLIKTRNCLALQWSKYNPAKQTYTIVRGTLKEGHEIYACPPDQVAVHGVSSVWIKTLSETTSFISIVISVKPEILPLPASYWHKRLIQRIHLLRSVKFDEIYANWVCLTCKFENDPYLLDCRKCHVARYWKCLAKNCRRSQPITSVGKCAYCQQDRE